MSDVPQLTALMPDSQVEFSKPVSAKSKARFERLGRVLSSAERVRIHTDTLKGRLTALLRGAKASAASKGYTFNLCKQDLSDLWISQSGLCTYTGLPMSTATNTSNLVSVERKDSNLGYSKANCELVCWPVNRAKNTMSKADFLALCSAIVSHQG